MEIGYKLSEGCLTVCLRGELDHHGAKDAIPRITEQIGTVLPMRCVLDLSGLSFMDSSGLAVILAAHRRLGGYGGRLSISGAPEQPSRVIKASGIELLLELEETAKQKGRAK